MPIYHPSPYCDPYTTWISFLKKQINVYKLNQWTKSSIPTDKYFLLIISHLINILILQTANIVVGNTIMSSCGVWNLLHGLRIWTSKHAINRILHDYEWNKWCMLYYTILLSPNQLVWCIFNSKALDNLHTQRNGGWDNTRQVCYTMSSRGGIWNLFHDYWLALVIREISSKHHSYSWYKPSVGFGWVI